MAGMDSGSGALAYQHALPMAPVGSPALLGFFPHCHIGRLDGVRADHKASVLAGRDFEGQPAVVQADLVGAALRDLHPPGVGVIGSLN